MVLMMLALPPILGNERLVRRRMLGIGAAVSICLLYYALQFLAFHLGDNHQLPPSVAALAPTLLGGSAGCLLLDWTPT
jgi:lipopolysaccharide export LptBFGC system permease protein LptF